MSIFDGVRNGHSTSWSDEAVTKVDDSELLEVGKDFCHGDGSLLSESIVIQINLLKSNHTRNEQWTINTDNFPSFQYIPKPSHRYTRSHWQARDAATSAFSMWYWKMWKGLGARPNFILFLTSSLVFLEKAFAKAQIPSELMPFWGIDTHTSVPIVWNHKMMSAMNWERSTTTAAPTPTHYTYLEYFW